MSHAEFGSNDYQEYVVYVGVPILKIGKCCEGVRALPTLQKSENSFRSVDIPSIVTQSVVLYLSITVL